MHRVSPHGLNAYEVFKKQEGDKLRKIAITKKCTYTDVEEDVIHTVGFTYYVRAKSYEEKGITYMTGGVSKGRKQVFVKRSGKVKVSKKEGTLSWTPTKDVDGYLLLVSHDMEMKNGQKLTLGNVTSISLKDVPQISFLPAGTYYISLRQYVMRDGKRYVSAYQSTWWNKTKGLLEDKAMS